MVTHTHSFDTKQETMSRQCPIIGNVEELCIMIVRVCIRSGNVDTTTDVSLCLKQIGCQ